ncbi:hypothetical protein NDU88_003709 [Pleurodeles waltl]|uniref:Uncharacterized protein n=1 Tax=Pleurodeles waltl TaxID=8319 RepID=A0AAV7MWE0_PLEWA|nr:hypothetical protein NDU88_003709 [Pleurodeles waltl]
MHAAEATQWLNDRDGNTSARNTRGVPESPLEASRVAQPRRKAAPRRALPISLDLKQIIKEKKVVLTAAATLGAMSPSAGGNSSSTFSQQTKI